MTLYRQLDRLLVCGRTSVGHRPRSTAAAQAGVATPLGAEATALYTLFVNAGNGGLDYSGIVKLIRGD